MATVADTRGVTGKPPVSAHPAFPAIVALWFAALFGLGTLVVPAALLEQAALVSGLAKIVPAAEPPLGMTARALVALGGTVLGALLGLVIARRMAGAHAFSRPGRAAAGRMPINAHDELGDEGLDGAHDARGTRRRSLALAEDGGPSDFLERAPLPAGHVEATEDTLESLDLDGLDLADLDTDSIKAEDEEFEFDDEDGFADFEEDDDLPPQMFIAAATASSIEIPVTIDRAIEDEAASDTATTLEVDENWADEAFEPEPEAEPDEVTVTEGPMDFAAPTPDQPPVASAPAPTTDPVVAAPDARPGVTDEPRPAWADASLEDLGLVQLAQRLADSIERHREFRSARAALATGTAVAPRAPAGDFEVAEADEAVEAIAAYFARPATPVIPAAEAVEPETVAADEEEFEPATGDAPRYEEDEEDDSDADPAPFAAFPVARPVEADDPADADAEPEEVDEGESLFARLGGIPRVEEAAQDEEFVAETPAEDEFSDADFAEEDESGEQPVEERQVFQPAVPQRDERKYQPFAAFASLDEDEDEDDSDLSASFSLPVGSQPQSPAPAPEATPEPAAEERIAAIEEELESDEPADMTGYGSLLGKRNPFKDKAGEFVRIEDEPEADDGMVEPAVVFPAEGKATTPSATPRTFDKPAEAPQPAPVTANSKAAVNPEENERALREALLNLQRMSGAA